MDRYRTVPYSRWNNIPYAQVQYLTQDGMVRYRYGMYLIQDRNGAECVGFIFDIFSD